MSNVHPPEHAPSRLGLWLAGMPGVLAVTLIVVPQLAAKAPLPLWAIVAISAAQSALLLAFAVWVGGRCAPPTGLAAPVFAALRGRRAMPPLRPLVLAGLAGGLAGAAILLVAPRFAPASLAAAASHGAGGGIPVLVRVLYGGITEEIMLRWGFMSFVLWGLWRLVQRGEGKPGAPLVACAIAVSALAFGAGHLPAAAAIVGHLDAGLVLYVLAGNALFGLVAGTLYWRWGLECAMLAHAVAHLLAWGIAG